MKRSFCMNRTTLKILLPVALLTVHQAVAEVHGRSFFLPVSQHATAVKALALAGRDAKIDATHGVLSNQIEYKQSFDDNDIAEFFWPIDSNTIHFGAIGASTTDVASYFFLLGDTGAT